MPARPAGWYRATDIPATTVPFGRFGPPYVFRTTAPSPGPAPATVSGFTLKPIAAGTEVTMTIVPQSPGLTAAFVLPEGVRAVAHQPARASSSAAAGARPTSPCPPDGVTWRASFKTGLESRLPATQAVIWSSRVPGGGGWQSLPAWLPQEHVVWDVNSRRGSRWLRAPVRYEFGVWRVPVQAADSSNARARTALQNRQP